MAATQREVLAGALTNTVAINNASATDRTLALRVYAGEVTRAFRRKNIMAPLHARRDMRYGKSMQFPAAGRLTASFHVKGNNILSGDAGVDGTLSAVNMVERLVHVDNILVAGSFIAEIDEHLEHYDSRSTVADEAGGGLALFYDQLAIRQVTRAARTNTTTDSTFVPTDLGSGGSGVDQNTAVGGYVGATAFNTEATIIAALEDAAQILDEKYIPDEDRHAPLTPAHYWTLINNDKTISVDYSRGNGDFAKGQMYYAAGFQLHKTNHIPTDWWNDGGSASGATDQPTGAVNDYYGDNRNLHTTVFHKSAIATVWLMDVSLEMEHLIEYIGTPVLAKMLAGTGRLRAEAAVEISSQTTQENLTGL